MKKTIIAAILAGSILLSACSAIENVTADTLSSNTATLPTEQITIETPAPDATVSPIVTASPDPTPEVPDEVAMPDAEQNIEETTKNVAAMMPILDSIMRVTGTTGDTEYAPDDPDFFWRVLHQIGNSWGTTHPFVEPSDDGVIKIQTRVMGDFASAAFSTYSLFPEIPANLRDSVKYDAQNDEYILSLSDTGGTYTNLDAVSTLQDGSVIAIVGLYEGAGNPEDLLGSVTFTLVKKPSANENRTTNYLYSVTDATKAPK